MLSKEQLDLLKRPLPPEAITPHPTKSYLSNIKAIYVVERMNDVFGIGGWKVKNEVVDKVDIPTKTGKKQMIVVKSIFIAGDIEIENYGGNDNEDLGDAYKGACTDALTKIGSYLGVGMDVFKGLATKTPQNAYYAQKKASEKSKEELNTKLDAIPPEKERSGYGSVTRSQAEEAFGEAF